MMEPQDEGFILDSWVRQLRTSHWSGVLDKRRFREAHVAHFAEVLRRPEVRVFVAVNPHEEDPRFELYGYLVTEEGHRLPIVHWVYVKRGQGPEEQSMRRKYVATELFRHAGIDPLRQQVVITCRTPVLSKVQEGLRARGERLRYEHDPRFLQDPTWKEKQRDKALKNRFQRSHPAAAKHARRP